MSTSFDAITRAVKFWVEQHPEGRADTKFDPVRSKLHYRAFFEKHNIPCAKLKSVITRPQELTLELIGAGATIKPVAQANARGVYVVRVEQEVLINQWTQKRTSLPALHQALSSQPLYGPWVVEELVEPAQPPLVEYKVFCFSGKPRWVLGRVLPTPKRHTWTADWKDFNRAGDVPVPAAVHATQLVSLASDVAQKLGFPFSRIDLFDSSRGPLVNELNAWSSNGKRKEWKEWDSHLGGLWLAAAGGWPVPIKVV